MNNIFNDLESLKQDFLYKIESFGKALGDFIGVEMKIDNLEEVAGRNDFSEVIYEGKTESGYVYFSICPFDKEYYFDDHTKKQLYEEKIRLFIRQTFYD